MKITSPDAIKNAERELIDGISGDLDWSAIEEIFKKRHKLAIEDDVKCKQGDIVVYNDQIAYKIEFEARVTLSVLFDRDGNYLSFASTGDLDKPQQKNEGELLEEAEPSISPDALPQEKISRMASQIADMIPGRKD